MIGAPYADTSPNGIPGKKWLPCTESLAHAHNPRPRDDIAPATIIATIVRAVKLDSVFSEPTNLQRHGQSRLCRLRTLVASIQLKGLSWRSHSPEKAETLHNNAPRIYKRAPSAVAE